MEQKKSIEQISNECNPMYYILCLYSQDLYPVSWLKLTLKKIPSVLEILLQFENVFIINYKMVAILLHDLLHYP